MSKASQDGKWLVENSHDDRTMSSSVRNLLSSGSTPLDSLEKKLGGRKNRLQAAIIFRLESESAIQLINERLLNLEEKAANIKVSANLATVTQQSAKNEALISQAGELHSCLREVMASLVATEIPDEDSSVKSSVREQADTLLTRLQEIESMLWKKRDLVHKVRPLAEQIKSGYIQIDLWFQDFNGKVAELEKDLVLEPALVAERQKQLEVSISHIELKCIQVQSTDSVFIFNPMGLW